MSWYTDGSINVEQNSKKIIGVNTKWTNPLIGICSGQMLILKTQNTIEIYEIASVQSDTELTLAIPYTGGTKSGLKYEIPTVPKLSIESLALRISEMLNYYQQQMEGWQTLLTGEGEVTLTAPDGRVVTIKSHYSINQELLQLVEQSKKFSDLASKSATAATDAATKSTANAASTKTDADNVIKSARQAADSANAAKTSETNANNSAKNAKTSENNAKKWASTVDTSTFIKNFGDMLTTINLNDLTGPYEGIYYQGCNILAVIERGYPTNQAGTLLVFKNGADGDGCCQIYTTYRNAQQFIRNYLGNTKTWGPWIEQITTANMNKYFSIGDFRLMPFRANELPFGWYVRNGDNYLLNSPQGQALNKLSDNYKRDHQITIKNINGQQHINTPTAFTSDGRGFFERAVNGEIRQVGNIEGDAIREIWGHFDSGVIDNHHEYALGAFSGSHAINQKNGAFEPKKEWDTWGYDFNASRVVPTANENRPINMGLTPVIYLGV